jgi:hypothetical protein
MIAEKRIVKTCGCVLSLQHQTSKQRLQKSVQLLKSAGLWSCYILFLSVLLQEVGI